MLNKTRRFVRESFGKENPHLKRTLYWVKKLKPDAGEELLIAACSHDIERAFKAEKKIADKFKYSWGKAMDRHQRESGRIMFDFLVKEGYDARKAKRVQELISHHEIGGSAMQNLLKDADSLSWLEVSALRHMGFIEEKGLTKRELRKKINFMYDRISSKKNKMIAKPFYEKAVKMLSEME